VEPVQLLVRECGAVRAVDEGGVLAELGGVPQDGLVDRERYGRNVCVLAAEHGSSRTVGAVA
jgi:hypothetical protein